MLRRRAIVLALLALVPAACGDGGDAAGAEGGQVTVLAAASLTDVFGDLEVGARFSFGGSQSLATQLEQGAPADVFASADERTMQRLVDAGVVEHPQVFARNSLEIVVAPGNPEGVRGLADLARSDLVVVLEDPSVPAGAYAAEALRRAGVEVRPRSLELDVRATLSKVTSGEADAAIVYRTDVVAAGDRAEGVVIPPDQNVVAEYPIAVVTGTSRRAAAEAFVDEVASGAGQEALRRRGFQPAG